MAETYFCPAGKNQQVAETANPVSNNAYALS